MFGEGGECAFQSGGLRWVIATVVSIDTYMHGLIDMLGGVKYTGTGVVDIGSSLSRLICPLRDVV